MLKNKKLPADLVFCAVLALLGLLIIAYNSPAKLNTGYTDRSDFIFTATTAGGMPTTSSTAISWGGMVLFRVTDENEKNEKRVAVSITDRENITHEIPAKPPYPICTLNMDKCIWRVYTNGWNLETNYRPRKHKGRIYIKIVLRPDGSKLSDADARIYVDENKLLDKLVIWEPPSNFDDTGLIVDANWEKK